MLDQWVYYLVPNLRNMITYMKKKLKLGWKKGILTYAHEAFSRDQAHKIYV